MAFPSDTRYSRTSVIPRASISMPCPSSTQRSQVLGYGTHPQTSTGLVAIPKANYIELRCIVQHACQMSCQMAWLMRIAVSVYDSDRVEECRLMSMHPATLLKYTHTTVQLLRYGT